MKLCGELLRLYTSAYSEVESEYWPVIGLLACA